VLALLLGLWCAANAVVIEVHGTVDEELSQHVRTSLEKAQAEHPAAVVLDVDTWGGELESAFEISDAITNAKVPTVTFVRRKAISAGALIGLSAGSVYMAPGATLGDCAPIIPTDDGPHFLGEKIESPLRARFRALAKRHRIPDLLAEKMVTKDMEVVQTVDSAGHREYFTSKNFGELVGEARQRFTAWTIVVADGQLLTVDDREALDLGFSQGTFADLDSLAHKQGWSLEKPLRPTWSSDLAKWLSDLSPVLFLLGFALLWIEYKAGGFAFGLAGFLLLATALGSKYLIGLSDRIPLLLAALGLLLFLLEAWFLPGTVLPAALGLVCLLAAFTMSLQGFSWPDPSNHAQVHRSLVSLGLATGALLGGLLVSILFVRYGLRRFSRRDGMHLSATLDSGNGQGEMPDLSGRIGLAVGVLRPGGLVEVDGIRVEGKSLAGFLDRGRTVRLLRRNGSGWDVEPIE
jgi:membrane-bound serine protease (ClpP class)